jgi:hypothetical protein
MANFREPTLEEVGLHNTFTELELGNELLDLQILEASKAAANLVRDLIDLQDS